MAISASTASVAAIAAPSCVVATLGGMEWKHIVKPRKYATENCIDMWMNKAVFAEPGNHLPYGLESCIAYIEAFLLVGSKNEVFFKFQD